MNGDNQKIVLINLYITLLKISLWLMKKEENSYLL